MEGLLWEDRLALFCAHFSGVGTAVEMMALKASSESFKNKSGEIKS